MEKQKPNPQPEPRRQGKKSARQKVMDLLAKRDHSEYELRKKLADDYPLHEIDEAIELARESRWLAPPEELSERAARALGRKRKSHRYINQFLTARGLPHVGRELDVETEKGVALVRARLRNLSSLDRQALFEARLKARRLLTNRGFDGETIRRVLDRLTSGD
jgi:regulatory protein